jgi:nitroimidazol reductase NimA-like FMN-containing flavoprotein (pyridoxamine 5'-phosphate oxidase superfamily)
MRRAEREIKDRQAIEDILHRATVCRLAVCDGHVPYVVPLSFGFEDNRLYFHSAREGRKIEVIEANPQVSFEVDLDHEVVPGDIPCGWTVRYRSVVGFGQARLLEDVAQKKRALDIILGHYGCGASEYTQGAFDEVAVVEVEIESLTGKQSGY